MADYILEMMHVSKTFPGVKALDDVYLGIEQGEVHALVGENGAGKSTLIKVLAGVHAPDEGAEIFFEGEPAKIDKPIDATTMGVSVIYQDLSLFPNLSVAENICIGKDGRLPAWSFMNWKKMKRMAEEALDEMDVPIDVNKNVDDLSIAQQQMVEIARAIAFDAKLIVMDEPTSSLSHSEVEKLYNVIDKLKAKGISIIFISHKLKELFKVSDRISVLRDGKYIGSYHMDETTEEKLITLMVGRDVSYERKSRFNQIADEVVLELKQFTKKGNFKNISLQLKKGEILGITGLVGSGRSELAQAIFGLNKPDSGTLHLHGKKAKVRSSNEAMKHGIAYIPEDRKKQGLVLNQPVTNNISLPVLRNMKNPLRLLKKKDERKMADDYVERLDVRPALPDLKAMQLSGGNQQKVVISKWLATEPDILIIDEPTNGIDIGAKTEIHKLLQELADKGIAVIVISSELPEVLAVSDRILVMRQGRVVSEMSGHDASQEKIMNFAFLGSSDKEIS
ncbi:sugar ABC transporter ATP-binding protein [Thalassobacillus sp. CUG 92003]|uniref:sugar ABC transporter ATP-binding protein n=1 Tax=Thalassobacillus sp. CUG 92003 TaxID=2736641 RepID=UPI0015E6D0F4|nr:sugar ABC transporter ATP-binding protein [Thalassobacillus sp. CUG 92003]